MSALFMRAAAMIGIVGLTPLAWDWSVGTSIVVNPFTGKVVIENLVVPLDEGGSIRIGRVAWHKNIALITPAFAAENLTLQNVSIDIGGIHYRASEIGFVGSSLSQKDFTALLDKTAPQSFAEQLTKFSASAISIPEAVAERRDGKQTITVRNLVLRDIVGGKVATITTAGGTIKGPAPVDLVFGEAAGLGLDLALAARQLSSDPPSERDPKLLFVSATADTIAFKGSNDVRVEIGRASSNNVLVQAGERGAHILPLIGTFQLSQASVDVPNTKVSAERLKWTIKNFVLTTDELREGIPTRFVAAVTDLAMLLPQTSADPTMKNMIDLGYTSLVFSLLIETNWNPQNNELTIKQLAANGAEIGSMDLRGTLGKITKDVFSADSTKSRVALNGATVKTMSISIENKGLYEHALARDARKKGRPLEEMRRELALASTATVNALMARSDNRVLSGALAKFATKPGKLNIVARSKNPAGVPFTDFTESKDTRAAIEGKFDVTATAE